MAHSLRLHPAALAHNNFNFNFKPISTRYAKPTNAFNLRIRSSSQVPENAHRLVAQVNEKLKKEHSSLPVGKCGRDDEEMILWFLKDRRFSVEETITKLSKAIKWREEFHVSELTEESVKRVAASGKGYLHNHLDVHGRPVLIVDGSKHFPNLEASIFPLIFVDLQMRPLNSNGWLQKKIVSKSTENLIETVVKHQEYEQRKDEKLFIFLVEKAIRKLPAGKQDILVILDLRRFQARNADLKFTTFVFDVFYCYYPKRLSEVVFVDAPFVFKPFWQLVKPLLKSYASLVRFYSEKDVKQDYFTADTLPANF